MAAPSTNHDTNNTTLGTCKLCASSDIELLATIAGMPVDVGVLYDSAADAANAPRGEIRFEYCRNCGLTQNGTEEISYLFKPGYEVSLHHSPLYESYLEQLATDLAERYRLQGKHIVDIACGTGHFLEKLCRAGENQGIGVDPCVTPTQKAATSGTAIQFISDFYTEKQKDLPCDFVCCRHMLHAHSHPSDFLRLLRSNLGNRPVSVYFEVVNARYTAEQSVVWQILFEYSSYFTSRTLKTLFEACGFRVLRITPCFEACQYLAIEAVPDFSWDAKQRISASPDPAEYALFRHFASTILDKVRFWHETLLKRQKAGQRIALWGVAGRGITFLNLVEAAKAIPFVVDINPDRQGKFIPGSAQKIFAPVDLQKLRPDCLLLTNATYRDEIARQVASLGLSCEILVA